MKIKIEAKGYSCTIDLDLNEILEKGSSLVKAKPVTPSVSEEIKEGSLKLSDSVRGIPEAEIDKPRNIKTPAKPVDSKRKKLIKKVARDLGGKATIAEILKEVIKRGDKTLKRDNLKWYLKYYNIPHYKWKPKKSEKEQVILDVCAELGEEAYVTQILKEVEKANMDITRPSLYYYLKKLNIKHNKCRPGRSNISDQEVKQIKEWLLAGEKPDVIADTCEIATFEVLNIWKYHVLPIITNNEGKNGDPISIDLNEVSRALQDQAGMRL